MRHAWGTRVVTREAVDRRPGRTPLVAITRATKLRPRSRAVLSCVTVGGDSYSSVRRRGGRNGRRCRRRCRGPRRRRNDGAGYVVWGRSMSRCVGDVLGVAPAARTRRRGLASSWLLRGGRDAWHRWPPCRRGKGGRERREVRWAATGHSSGVLRQFARCWGRSWSHSYMASLK